MALGRPRKIRSPGGSCVSLGFAPLLGPAPAGSFILSCSARPSGPLRGISFLWACSGPLARHWGSVLSSLGLWPSLSFRLPPLFGARCRPCIPALLSGPLPSGVLSSAFLLGASCRCGGLLLSFGAILLPFFGARFLRLFICFIFILFFFYFDLQGPFYWQGRGEGKAPFLGFPKGPRRPHGVNIISIPWSGQKRKESPSIERIANKRAGPKESG